MARAEGIAAVLLSGTSRQSPLELKALQCMAASGPEELKVGVSWDCALGARRGSVLGANVLRQQRLLCLFLPGYVDG